MTLFCGIDWAEAHHDAAIVDSDGQLVAKKRITEEPIGFAKLPLDNLDRLESN